MIVTATGFNLQYLGGVRPLVDGEEVDIASMLTYKGMMASGVPNLAFSVGYTNASWTLKVELTCEFVCRLLNHMDATARRGRAGGRRPDDPARSRSSTSAPATSSARSTAFRSRARAEPWRLRQNYLLDSRMIRRGPIDDGALRFSSAAAREQRPAEALAG